VSSWRPLLRMARREALRARPRTALVLLLIALPVMGATAADVVLRTADVGGAEAVERRTGSADVVVSFRGGEVSQSADPNDGLATQDEPATRRGRDAGPDEIAAALGRPVRAIARVDAAVRVRVAEGVARAEGAELDLRDPLAHGLVRLLQGRFPAGADEVAVNPVLAERGIDVGGALTLASGRTLTVVGLLEDGTNRQPGRVWALPGVLGLDPERGGRSWFVDASGPVRWEDVRRLNEAGAMALSPAVLADPPAASEIPPEISNSSGIAETTAAAAALVVVMALLEVVLLAGPAFAVGARRQSRNLALLASCGATRKQLRRVVLAHAVVLGLAGALLGIALGVAAAVAVLPIAERRGSTFYGPLDLPWLHLAGIALFGVTSAILAALAPAVLASRQDVVAVLAGRRGDRRPDPRSPVLGLLLLGSGVALSVVGATHPAQGELLIAVGAVVAVVGMIFVIPLLLAVLGWAARALPLPLRYAVRDAARHRSRTVPAVAAVAATVMGVVALGIAASSDAKEYRETYRAALPMGTGWLQAADPSQRKDWSTVTETLARELPDNAQVAIRGLPAHDDKNMFDYSFLVDGMSQVASIQGSILGPNVLVSDTLPDLGLGEPAGSRAAADRVLAQGGAVVFTSAPVDASTVAIVFQRSPLDGGPSVAVSTTQARALFVPTEDARVQAVVGRSIATRIGVTPVETGIRVAGPISPAAQQSVAEAVEAVNEYSSFYVERGYTEDRGAALALLVLGAVGALLMLGGTLTVTFLSLSDARPDLATLAAVGASPASRRLVAASFAGTVGLVGAVLGAAVGFIPGYAVTFPLTDESGWYGGRHTHFLDVPWLLVGAVVVLLPLLASLVVGLAARSRLPTVARIT
jgi:putative ABC transport system permease protein